MENEFCPIIFPTADHAQAYLIRGIGSSEPVNSYFRLVTVRYHAPTLNVAGHFCVDYYSDTNIDNASTVYSFVFFLTCGDSSHVERHSLCPN